MIRLPGADPPDFPELHAFSREEKQTSDSSWRLFSLFLSIFLISRLKPCSFFPRSLHPFRTFGNNFFPLFKGYLDASEFSSPL